MILVASFGAVPLRAQEEAAQETIKRTPTLCHESFDEGAVERIEKAFERERDPLMHFYLGECYRMLGQIDDAPRISGKSSPARSRTSAAMRHRSSSGTVASSPVPPHSASPSMPASSWKSTSRANAASSSAPSASNGVTSAVYAPGTIGFATRAYFSASHTAAPPPPADHRRVRTRQWQMVGAAGIEPATPTLSMSGAI